MAILLIGTACGTGAGEPTPAQVKAAAERDRDVQAPTAQAANAAASAQTNAVPAISADKARALLRSGAVLVDVREPAELRENGWLVGAINRPMSSFGRRARELPRDRPIILYCRSGRRSAVAGDILTAMGFEQVLNLGGFDTAASAGWPTDGP